MHGFLGCDFEGESFKLGHDVEGFQPGNTKMRYNQKFEMLARRKKGSKQCQGPPILAPIRSHVLIPRT